MQLLALSDEPEDRVYELIRLGQFSKVGVVFGCGDLPYQYLENIVSALNVDLYYVPGNHDPAGDSGSAGRRINGGVDLDARAERWNRLLIAGLGGSIRYRMGAPNQHSQAAAFARVARLVPALLANRRRTGRALDILITHSPPFGIHDDDSSAHRGLKAINWLLDWAQPAYHLHGHMHVRRHSIPDDVAAIGKTRVINVFPYQLLELPNAG